MRKLLLCALLLMQSPYLAAQPSQAELFELGHSIVHILVDLKDGSTGSGSGVVVNGNYVATNCHVLADGRGVVVSKFEQSYTPIALKADWKHDVCLLKFADTLPIKSIPLGDSAGLKYEQEVFALGFPNDAQAPQPSFGSIKGIYPFDGSVILRSSAAFALGSSGGALFDQDFNLIGMTTFKSPGRHGYYYSLPVEWIRRLFDAPDQFNLAGADAPFWSWPEAQRPYFMRVVIPYQQAEWQQLQQIAGEWLAHEPGNADAFYYRAIAELELQGGAQEGIQDLKRTVHLNPRHLDALMKLASLAAQSHDRLAVEEIRNTVLGLDPEQAEPLILLMASMD